MTPARHEPAQAASDIGLLAPYAALSDEQLLAHLRSRTNAAYFPVADAEETHPDKIEAIMQNRFEFNGESYVLSAPLDWLTNPSADVEWHILLHKFYYAVGLGMGYRAGGDARYVVRWMALTSSWIEQTPIGFIAADVTGRRVQNWIYAFHYFVTQSPAAPVCPAFVRKFLDSLREQVNYLCENLTPARNHRTLELYAIFLASVAFPEFRDAAHWRSLSVAELARNIETDLLPDGVHCELSTDYHHLVLKNFLNVRRLAELNAIILPSVFDQRLVQALEFSMHAHKPDGIVPSLSDGDARGFLDLLHYGAQLYQRADMLYVATRGAAGTPPEERVRAFSHSGYYTVRSGWGGGERAYEDEQYLIFDCGPLGAGNHGHLDCLSFELAAFGRSLIVDPGRYTYNEAGDTNWRVTFRGTAYHNTISVDGKNQTRYEPRAPKQVSGAAVLARHRIGGPAPQAQLHALESCRGLDYLHGSARSHEYDAVHERLIAFVFDEYWLLCDRLSADETHSYDLRLHLAPQAQGATHITRRHGTLWARSPNLLIAHEDVGDLLLSLEEGYVSLKYGEKHAAPVVRLSRRERATRFHTLLYPYREHAPELAIRELRIERADDGQADPQACACALRITIGVGPQARTDYLLFGDSALAQWRCGDYVFSGGFVALRQDAYGERIALRASADAQLREHGRVIYSGVLLQ